MTGAFRYDLIPRGSRLLCALSGGADSMYLLCRLLEGAEEGGYAVCCAHYDHGLRDSAAGDAEFVRAWCGAHGIDLTLGRGDVGAEAAKNGMGLEECAREMRYAFLRDTAREKDCDLIVTGHHAGDNGETVLMNLIRGSGLRGLCGIAERQGDLLRPMLSLSRNEILAYLKEHRIPHVEDETNADDRYTRNKLRHRVLPLLEEINPRAAEHLSDTARRLREDEELLSSLAEELLTGAEFRAGRAALPAETLKNAPRPLAVRACAMLARQAGLGMGAVHLEAALALCAAEDPSARVSVPGGLVRREYDKLVFCRDEADAPPAPVPLGERVSWGNWVITCRETVCPEKAYRAPTSFFLRPGEYTLRSRREGDEVKLGKRPRKSVKKLMIEAKIPAQERVRVPVLDCGGRPAALGGFGPDAGYLAEPGAPALHITMTEENAL